jgi:hypothetical protein
MLNRYATKADISVFLAADNDEICGKTAKLRLESFSRDRKKANAVRPAFDLHQPQSGWGQYSAQVLTGAPVKTANDRNSVVNFDRDDDEVRPKPQSD